MRRGKAWGLGSGAWGLGAPGSFEIGGLVPVVGDLIFFQITARCHVGRQPQKV